MLTTIEKVLQRATPESQGISSAAILGWVEAMESQVHELQSFMLVRHGKVVAEGWWSPYGRDYPHMLYSVSKSFTATAVGLALNEGHFSIDDVSIKITANGNDIEITPPPQAIWSVCDPEYPRTWKASA